MAAALRAKGLLGGEVTGAAVSRFDGEGGGELAALFEAVLDEVLGGVIDEDDWADLDGLHFDLEAWFDGGDVCATRAQGNTISAGGQWSARA